MRDLITIVMPTSSGTELTVDGYVHYHTESDYGVDADGRRGVSTTFVDDVTDVQAYDQEGEDVELSEEQEQEAIDLLTRKFLES